MSLGAPAAADVPGIFDVVINGKGYVFANQVDPNLPFRTQRAEYNYTRTFVDRSNVGNAYGDDQQSFWLTASQNDWSNGIGQRYFRVADTASRSTFWSGTAIDTSTPGIVYMQKAVTDITAAANVVGVSQYGPRLFYATATTLYEVSSAAAVSRGAHGVTPSTYYCIAFGPDSGQAYINHSAGIRKWVSGDTFSAFSATGTSTGLFAGSIFHNNTLYTWDSSSLYSYDTAGVRTTVFTWKDPAGANAGTVAKVVVYGSKLAILVGYDAYSTSTRWTVWTYDGTSTAKIWDLPGRFSAGGMCVLHGIIYVSGISINARGNRISLYANNSGTEFLAFEAPKNHTSTINTDCAPTKNGVVFYDNTNSTLFEYNVGTGGTTPIATVTNFTFSGGSGPILIQGGLTNIVVTQSGQTRVSVIDSSNNTATSSTVESSLFDFDSSLTKVFRGIKVDADVPTGATFDIAYATDSVDSGYTSLQTGATSGTEYTMTGVTGHSISVQVTLNKGSSSAGAALKRVYVRAAPVLNQYKQRRYLLLLSGRDGKTPVICRNGKAHPLDGKTQATNLITAATTTTPFTITDEFGSFTGLVDLSQDFRIIEVRPKEFMAVVPVREV